MPFLMPLSWFILLQYLKSLLKVRSRSLRCDNSNLQAENTWRLGRQFEPLPVDGDVFLWHHRVVDRWRFGVCTCRFIESTSGKDGRAKRTVKTQREYRSQCTTTDDVTHHGSRGISNQSRSVQRIGQMAKRTVVIEAQIGDGFMLYVVVQIVCGVEARYLR